MHHFRPFWLATVAHAASAHRVLEEGETSITNVVELSVIQPFAPWPGYFEDQGALGMTPESVNACRSILSASPQDAGWLLEQAVCDRQDPDLESFTVDCVGKADTTIPAEDTLGSCAINQMCIEFHGQNELNESAWGVTCGSLETASEWVVSAQDPAQAVCGPYYWNNVGSNKAVNISLQVNVLDSQQLNRIGPANIYFYLDDKAKIGVERAYDPVVGSGIITVPYNSQVQACVEAMPGQLLNGYANIDGMALLA